MNHLKKQALVSLIVFWLLVLVCAPSHAIFSTYTDFTTWNSEVGPAQTVQDFFGFTTDTEFRTQPLQLPEMTISTINASRNVYNSIETSQYGLDTAFDINGTSYLFGLTGYYTVGNAGAQKVRIDFTDPVSAWGATFNGLFKNNFYDLDTSILVYDQSDALLGKILPDSGPVPDQSFYGFGITGNFADHLIFETISDEDAWGMDNVYFNTEPINNPVPEPSTFLLLGGGLAGLAFVMRRRKRE